MPTEVKPGRPHGQRPAPEIPTWLQRYLAAQTKELLRRARKGVDFSHERLAQQVIIVAARHGTRAASIRSLRISFSKYEHGHSEPGMRNRHLVAEALDGAAPYFATYRTACGGYVVVDAIDKAFFATLLDVLDLSGAGLGDQYNRTIWPQMKDRLAARFRERDRQHWAKIFADPAGVGYVLPVSTLDEALTLRIEMFGLDVDRHFRW